MIIDHSFFDFHRQYVQNFQEMRKKTIVVDEFAYERLDAARREGESHDD